MREQNPKRKLTGKVTKALSSVCLDLLLGLLAELDSIGAIDLLANGLDLLSNRNIEIIKELEVGFAFAGSDNGFSQCASTSTTLSPVIADNCSIGTTGESLITNELEFGRGVGTRNIATNFSTKLRVMIVRSLTQTG